jgi:phenylacetate-CoA ligase
MRSMSVSREWLLRRVVLRAGDVVFGQGMMERLAYLEKAQWWPRERIHHVRNTMLRRLIAVAWQEVPFYRELMQSAGVNPQDIRVASDLSRLPIVDKAMLRSQYPDGVVRSTGRKDYEVCSSGSTGANFTVREDAPTAGMHRAAFLLALQWTGWRFGEPHLQTGITPLRSLDRRLKDRLLRCHYFSAFDLTDAHLDEMLTAIRARRIEHVWGYPGSLYCLSRRAQQTGGVPAMRSVVTWGDNLYPHYRAAIESAFHTRVLDTYGCGEGMQIAAQCGERDHYHVHALDVIVEHVDERGRPVAPGETGHVIVTRLHPGPMPLIRYRIGDLAQRGSEDLCACGRGLDLMGRIQGRDTDVVVTPGGNRLIVHFFTGVLEHFADVECFQVVQPDSGSVVVRVVTACRGDAFDSLAARVAIRLREAGMDGLDINVEQVAEIPAAPSGKRRFVISHVAAA